MFHKDKENKKSKDELYLEKLSKIIGERNNQRNNDKSSQKLSLIDLSKLNQKNEDSRFEIMEENKKTEIENETKIILETNENLKSYIEEKSKIFQRNSSDKLKIKLKKIQQEEKWKHSKENLIKNKLYSANSKFSRNHKKEVESRTEEVRRKVFIILYKFHLDS